MKKGYTHFIVIFFTTSLFFGQAGGDKEKIIAQLNKTQRVYEGTPVFRLSVQYNFFPTYHSNVSSEKYSGTVLRNNLDYYTKINMTEFIKLGNRHLKIDNESKLIQVTESGGNAKMDAVYDLNNLMSNFKDFKMVSEGNMWVCTMTAPKITFVPYAKVIIYIDKSKNTISRQVLYFLTQSKYRNAKGKIVSDYPRLELLFTNFEVSIGDMAPKFELGNYLLDAKKNILTTKYKGYKIIE